MSRFDFTTFSNTAKSTDARATIHAKAIEAELEAMPNSREKALALTKLEESVMWFRKALREVKD